MTESAKQQLTYPEYQNSGVEWLGEIPIHWDMRPLFALAGENKQRNVGNQETNVLSLSYGRIIRRDVSSNFGLLPESFETYQKVDPSDIVLRLTDLQNDQKSLRVGLVKEKGIITSAYIGLKLKNIDQRFCYYLLHSYDLAKVFYALGGGVRQSMNYSDLKHIPLLLPPIVEQQAIADFLDRETSKIDTLITELNDLLKLIAEKRQATISHAVTSGINPNVTMIDSGIEWMGEIPEHWEIEKGKYLFRQSSLPVQDDDEIVTCFRNGQVTLRRNRREVGFTNAVLELGYQGIRQGQLVVHSMDAFAGAIGISDSSGKCSPEYIICDPINNAVYIPYYGYLLREMALRGFIQAICPAVRERAPRIRFSDIKELTLPIPPIEEQIAIVDYIEAKTSVLQDIIVTSSETIQLFQERRSALIASAVTGKIRVTE